eukprot:6172636-Prymnesium_polylepis.1
MKAAPPPESSHCAASAEPAGAVLIRPQPEQMALSLMRFVRYDPSLHTQCAVRFWGVLVRATRATRRCGVRGPPRCEIARGSRSHFSPR